MASLAKNPHRIQRLFLKVSYGEDGLWSVALCKNGVFTEVIIDDFVPVKKGKIKFCNSRGGIWPILLEKAYVKLFGAYWNIGAGGGAVRALKDLTGAPVEFHFFDELSKEELYLLIKNA